MKIVINACYGGFSLSKEAYRELGLEWDGYGYADIKRDDPRLVACIEKLGPQNASGSAASLRVVEIPDGTAWRIEEYDGLEHIAEGNTWR